MVGEEGIREGTVGRRLEGEVVCESFETMIGKVRPFTAGERKEVSTEVGGRRLGMTGAGSAQEGEIKGHIIANER